MAIAAARYHHSRTSRNAEYQPVCAWKSSQDIGRATRDAPRSALIAMSGNASTIAAPSAIMTSASIGTQTWSVQEALGSGPAQVVRTDWSAEIVIHPEIGRASCR